jgi:hypothetical protein
MKVTQALVVAALVAAVGLGLWLPSGDREPSVASPARSTLVVPPPTLETPPPMPAMPAQTQRSQSLPASAPAVAAPPEQPPELAFHVTGRCIDAGAVALPRTRVVQLESAGAMPTEARNDGSFALTVFPNQSGVCLLRFDERGSATRFLEVSVLEGAETALGDVVLAPGGNVHGIVFGPDGAPFAGARVTVTPPDLWQSRDEAEVKGPGDPRLRLVVESGADGRFTIDGVELAPVRLWASASGMRHAVSPPIPATAEPSEDIELVLALLASDDRIRGIVLTPEGRPVVCAQIWGYERSTVGAVTLRPLESDGQGRFEIAAKAQHTYDLWAQDREGRWSKISAKAVLPGTRDLVLRFAPARWIEIEATAEDDATLESLVVGFRDERRLLSEETLAAPEGRARVLAPSMRFSIEVAARGYQAETRGPFEPLSAPERLTFELEPLPGVRGRVVANGAAVPGARVWLFDAQPGSQIVHLGLPSLVAPDAVDEATCDAEGRFVLNPGEASTYYVRAEGPGLAPGEIGPLELDPELASEELEVVLSVPGNLAGRVLMPPGRDPLGVIVVLNRGDSFPRSVRADAEGRFGFDGLMSGRWRLERGTADVNPKTASTSFIGSEALTVIDFNCTIRAGETTHQDLDLRALGACRLAGLLRVNGAPAEGWSLSAWPAETEIPIGTPASTSSAADGTFHLELGEAESASSWLLSFAPPAEHGAVRPFQTQIEVQPGTNTWQRDLPLGSVHGHCQTPPSKDQPLFLGMAPGTELSTWLPILPDARGDFLLPYVPAGRAILYVREPGELREIDTVEVVAGRESTVDVP